MVPISTKPKVWGFGPLLSLSHHSSAAFIASFCSSGFATTDNHHLMNVVNFFNSLVSSSDAISPESAIGSPPSQRSLSHKLDSLSFSNLYDLSSPANKARLLSASASLATSWVSVLPSGEPGTHFDPSEFRTAISWWLGLETTRASSCCLLCPEIALDPLGHHALSCRQGGDVVLRHNQLRDIFVDFCHKVNLSVKVEAGSTLTPDLSRSRLADALVSNWSDGIPTAFDITVTSLTPVSLQEASVTPGTAALLAERRKHQANDPKCHMLGWKCTPLAVRAMGAGEVKPGKFSPTWPRACPLA